MKKFTKILSLFFVAGIAFTLAACGTKTEAPTATQAPATTTKAPGTTTKAPTQAPTTTTEAHTKHVYSGEWVNTDPEGHYKTCDVCGNKSEVEDHEYKVDIVRPTLEEEGSKTYTCEVCGYTYTEKTGLAFLWEVKDDSYVLDYESKQADPHFTITYSEDGKTATMKTSDDYSWNALQVYASGKTEGYNLEVTISCPATATKKAVFVLKPNNVETLVRYPEAEPGKTQKYTYSGSALPEEMQFMVVMMSGAGLEGSISMRWAKITNELVDPELYILGNGYYNNMDASRYNTLITGDDTAKKFIATRFFTKDILPVGSIIEIADGYTFRAEGWKDENKQAARGPESKTTVVVDETWWGEYVKRAFNIKKNDGSLLNTPEAYAAAVAAFKIYVPKGTVIRPMEKVLPDVSLLSKDPTDLHTYKYDNYLVIAKNSGNSYEYVNIDVPNDMTGYTKFVINIQGYPGEKIMFKPNNNSDAQTTYTMDGTMQEFTLELPEGFAWNANAKEMIIMPNPNAEATKNNFLITKLEAQGEGKEAINLIKGTIGKANQCTAIRAFVLTKPSGQANEWDTVFLKLDNDFTGYEAVRYALQGTAGERVLLKVNDQKELYLDLDGTVQTGYIDVSEMTFDPSKLTMVIFINPDKAGTDHPVTIYDLTYTQKAPKKTVTPKATATGGSPISFNEEKVATIADTSKTGQWGRWDYSLSGFNQYNKVTVVLKGTAGLAFHAKLDTASTCPLGNNYFDGMAGNKTNAKFGEDGTVTLTWDLALFRAKCAAASKQFEVDFFSKLVFFIGNFGEGAAKSDVAQATIEVVSITFEK